jgi:hypothetical protein
MVSSCVNPTCCAQLSTLNEGDLYALERGSVDSEFFWLCSACVPEVALRLDAMGDVSVRLRSDADHPQPPHSDSRLRLAVWSAMDRMPLHRANRRPSVDAFNQIRERSVLFIMRSRIKPRNYLDTQSRVRKRLNQCKLLQPIP